ncbi:hypothetical protein [Lentzea sp. E54]|uniref:hypothetical protein n=1 Tax=Lentzea xerophila TaxID=3435883 RepID=UPI003DA46B46
MAFPFRENFPTRWQAFRRALLGLFLVAGVVIAVLDATSAAWIFGGVVGLGTVVSAVLRPKTKAAVPVA